MYLEFLGGVPVKKTPCTNPGLVVKKDCVKPIFKQTLVVDVGEKDGVCCVFILGKGVVPVLGLGTIALVMEGF